MKRTTLQKQIMPNESFRFNRTIRRCYFFLRTILERQKLVEEAKKALDLFCINVNSNDSKYKPVNDMIKMYRKYGFTFNEYLLYRFDQKTMKERLTFVADWERIGYACALNNSKNNDLYDNKWKTYERYKEYYLRDILCCDSISKKDDFLVFLQKHKKAIIKPISGSLGRGAQIISSDDNYVDYDSLLESYQGKFVVEELISQSNMLKKFHPHSVNTVRIPSIRMNDKVIIIHPFFRMGRKGSCVDNAGAGGIFSLIDLETGIIGEAVDEFGKSYSFHPETNEKIVGFQIPEWDKLKKLVNILALIVPENRYISWDFALTEKGWCIVEANRRGQFVWQIPMQIGFRDEINSILNAIGLKY